MNPQAILLPLCAQVLLTFTILMTLAFKRVTATRRSRINPQELADEARAQVIFKDAINLSDNFENLFEMPVLFYVAVLTIFVLGRTDSFYIGAAWAYFALRLLHSLIHSTLNHINSRFFIYLISCLVLGAIWTRIALQLVASMP